MRITFTAILAPIKIDKYSRLLLTNIIDDSGTLFRDHNWIVYSKAFDSVLSSTPTTITFKAKIVPYSSSEGTKLGLSSIRHIRAV